MEHKEILLIKNGELALKGLNRGTFEDILLKNIKRRLYGAGSFTLRKAQSTLYIEPREEGADLEEACDRLSRIFGISAYTRALAVDKSMEAILAATGDYLADELRNARTFKVEAKRSDKTFPLTSPAICAEVGGALLKQFPHLKVDVHQPQVQVTVEIRDFGAYIHAAQLPGAGGMPVGTGGCAADLGWH